MPHNAPALMAKVMDLLLDAVCVVDREGRFVAVSAACERIFGYRPDEMIGRAMIDLVHPEDRERTLLAATDIMAGETKPHFRNRYLRKDGEIAHIMWSARWSESDQLRIAVARDVSELALAESLQAAVYAISESAYVAHDLLSLFRHIHRTVAALLPPGHFVIGLCDDHGSDVTFPVLIDQDACAARTLLGERRCAEIIRAGAILPPASPQAEASSWFGIPLRSATGVIGALLVQSIDGQPRYHARHRDLLQYVSVQIAIAIERKQSELRMQHIALHDALTDLPNRELFRDRLNSALNRAQRNGTQVALLYVDLDGFKQVNDLNGHIFGDMLLREVGTRLQRSVREADTVGRIGGDEFMVVLDGVASGDDAVRVADKIRAQLEQPFLLGAMRLSISSSIGIALFPEHGRDESTLVRSADAAMYGAKAGGRNRVLLGRSMPDSAAGVSANLAGSPVSLRN